MDRDKTRNTIITLCVSAAMMLLGVLVFTESYLRLAEAARDLGTSATYWFCRVFGMDTDVTPTVNDYSEVLSWGTVLPENMSELTRKATEYFSMLFSGENFLGWLSAVGGFMSGLVKVLLIALPCALALVLFIRRLYRTPNNRHGRDTLPLKAFKGIARVTYVPLKRITLSYIAFVKERRWLRVIWTIMWLFHFNAVTVLAELLAYYFFFTVCFDFTTLYVQLNKLLIDMQVVLKHFPWWSVAVAAYLLFSRWRKRIALGRLRRFEARNCGFINDLPIVSMACGSMGRKKTTMITDMALSQEVMFRQKALEIMQKADMRFPHFPWQMLENELKKCIEYGSVHNLASVKAWTGLKRERCARHGNAARQLYGYDAKRYGMTYEDALKENGLFDVMETYAQAYFIYIMQSSLILSNYSIRSDNELIDLGNLPLWLTDFFGERRDGRRSHVLDFDVLRIGRKVVENNARAGSFEFGVVAITEIGKERGNNLELKEVKKSADEANQKNDLFNSWLKMCRHSATVDNFPFIKVFTDEQRPESWGADARDLCDIVHICSAGEQRLALPLYTIEDMLSEWAYNGFIRLYEKFRFVRGDNTLLVHILKSVTAWLWKRRERVYNRYGYGILGIEKERGTLEGKIDRKKYYLMNRKIYADRFSTDCFSDYFNDMALKSGTGIIHYPEYAGTKATVEELKRQNSYFMNSLYTDAGER